MFTDAKTSNMILFGVHSVTNSVLPLAEVLVMSHDFIQWIVLSLQDEKKMQNCRGSLHQYYVLFQVVAMCVLAPSLVLFLIIMHNKKSQANQVMLHLLFVIADTLHIINLIHWLYLVQHCINPIEPWLDSFRKHDVTHSECYSLFPLV